MTNVTTAHVHKFTATTFAVLFNGCDVAIIEKRVIFSEIRKAAREEKSRAKITFGKVK